MDDVTVDLSLSLHDAKAVRDALGQTIASGYLADATEYAALVQVKSRLKIRIANAEKTARWAEPA